MQKQNRYVVSLLYRCIVILVEYDLDGLIDGAFLTISVDKCDFDCHICPLIVG